MDRGTWTGCPSHRETCSTRRRIVTGISFGSTLRYRVSPRERSAAPTGILHGCRVPGLRAMCRTRDADLSAAPLNSTRRPKPRHHPRRLEASSPGPMGKRSIETMEQMSDRRSGEAVDQVHELYNSCCAPRAPVVHDRLQTSARQFDPDGIGRRSIPDIRYHP